MLEGHKLDSFRGQVQSSNWRTQTLVILMGARNLEKIVKILEEEGALHELEHSLTYLHMNLKHLQCTLPEP